MVRPPLLFLKMLRDMRRSLPAYLISGCIVTMGVVGYSVLSITNDNLRFSRQQFYRESAFADGFAEVQMASKAMERRIGRVDGITRAEGRLVVPARVTGLAKGDAELKLYSYTPDGLCRPLLQSGAPPGRRELLLSQGFMDAHGLSVGDSITLSLNGRRAVMKISGTALAPETIYMIKDIADLMPDPARYDAGYIFYDDLASLMGAEQQANSFVFLLDGSRDFRSIKEDLEVALTSYGVSSIYQQADQFSHAMVAAEMEQLQTMSTSVPFLFLAIAAVIITITLSRLVEQQRTQIGTLMALGLPPKRLLWHYCGYGILLGFLGGLIGGIAGIYAADAMGDFYREYFKIPSYGLYLSPWYFVGGIAVSVAVCGGIARHSAKGVLELTPALALRPAPPKAAGVTPLERLPGFFSVLTMPGRIAVRGLFRSGKRTLLSLFGVACAYMISAALLSMYSMLDVFIFDFLEVTQRQDFTVTFSRPVSEADALRAVRSSYIERAEGVAELPVTLGGPSGKLDCSLMALSADAELYQLFDKRGGRIGIPQSGLVISRHMAGLLGVNCGDSLEVKLTYPVERTEKVAVTGIAEQYLGSTAYTSRQELARIAGMGDAVTALYLKAAPEARPLLYEKLNDVGAVAGVQSRVDKVTAYRTMIGSFNGIFFAMAMMGVLIGFAVVYTGSLISFEELKREVSTLLTLGLSGSQAVEVISVGQWLIALGGMLLGVPMAVGVSKAISASMSTKLYSIPDFINLNSLVLAAGLTMLSVWLGTAVIHRRVNKLSPVELLRERE